MPEILWLAKMQLNFAGSELFFFFLADASPPPSSFHKQFQNSMELGSIEGFLPNVWKS